MKRKSALERNKKLRKNDFVLRLKQKLSVKELQRKRDVKKRKLKKSDFVLRPKLKLND